jgi:hypothetical protein
MVTARVQQLLVVVAEVSETGSVAYEDPPGLLTPPGPCTPIYSTSDSTQILLLCAAKPPTTLSSVLLCA